MSSDLTTPIVDTKLVGVSNYPDVARIEVGMTVQVDHEPDNEHDPNAFKVTLDGDTIGYLPRDVARRVIAMDTARSFTAYVTTVTTFEDATVGGYIAFDSPAGYRRPITHKENDMGSNRRIPEALAEQGAERYERGSGAVRPYNLPANTKITIIPLTDYVDAASTGDWLRFREVKAFGGIKVKGEREPVPVPGQLLTFPAEDFVVIHGKDGSIKQRWVTDPILERCAPSKFETRKPKDAGDDWIAPTRTRAKEVVYVNCLFVDGQLEKGERAKWNPKSGTHIVLSMSSMWFEQWKAFMDRDRKKVKDWSPVGRRWTLEIVGESIGKMRLEADDIEGPPVELPEPIDLDAHIDAARKAIEEYVAALDGVNDSINDALSDTGMDAEKPVADIDVEDADTDAFEEGLTAPAARDWANEPPARKKKLLMGVGVQVKPGVKVAELDALILEHEDKVLELLAAEAA